MYQALYRKYRPDNFNEVVGQRVIVKTLTNTIQNEKLSHAYLFTGPRGTGKTSIAKILAKTINCINPKKSIPCEECDNCIQYNRKQLNDIIEIDAASNNGVDEIREIKSKINIVPSNGKYKIYIIDEVHMLTTGAFNALLKTLEEPPSHIIFILATTEPHKIPSTVLSRCQRFDFKKLTVNQIYERLKEIAVLENIEIENEALSEISRLADGGMRDSLSIFEQVTTYSTDKITLEDVHEVNGTISQTSLKGLLDCILTADIQTALLIIDEYDKNGKNFVKICDELVLFFRNILLAIEVPTYLEKENSYASIYLEFSNKITVNEILEYIKVFNNHLNDLKFSNNPRLNFELLIISLLNKSETSDKVNADISLEKMNEKEKNNPKVEETIKTITNLENTMDETENILKKLKIIRVNNTLCNFDKKLFLKVKSSLQDLNSYILDSNFSKWATLILDGKLKAGNNQYLIFVYRNDVEQNIFNENILKIDKLLSKMYNSDMHAIAVSIEEWEKIKTEFNQKLKKYTYMEETSDIKDYYKNYEKEDSNSIEESFKDLIEYN